MLRKPVRLARHAGWQCRTIQGVRGAKDWRLRAAACMLAIAVLLLIGSVLPARADSGYVLEQLVWDEPATEYHVGLTAFDGTHLAAADNGSVSCYRRQGQVWHLEQRITDLQPVTGFSGSGRPADHRHRWERPESSRSTRAVRWAWWRRSRCRAPPRPWMWTATS